MIFQEVVGEELLRGVGPKIRVRLACGHVTVADLTVDVRRGRQLGRVDCLSDHERRCYFCEACK